MSRCSSPSISAPCSIAPHMRCGLAVLVSGLLASEGALAVEVLRPRVVASFPHDSTAFTQGLVSFGDQFFESTGLYERSSLRRVQRETGEVLQQIDLAEDEFGEGLAMVDERLLQLTWQNGVAHVYDRNTFERLESYAYEGEGWGLCFNGEQLVMSDGSSSLFLRNAHTFELQETLTVTVDGAPRDMLNELECVGDAVYANVWQTDLIVRIELSDGTVPTIIDASELLTSEERASADVLNGIAFDESSGSFFITGKLWPRLFQVEFNEPVPGVPVHKVTASDGCTMGARSVSASRAPHFVSWLLVGGLVLLRRMFGAKTIRQG